VGGGAKADGCGLRVEGLNSLPVVRLRLDLVVFSCGYLRIGGPKLEFRAGGWAFVVWLGLIAHETVAMHLPASLSAGLAQGLQESVPVFVIHEDVLPPVAAVHDMINGIRILNARFSSHGGQRKSKADDCNAVQQPAEPDLHNRELLESNRDNRPLSEISELRRPQIRASASPRFGGSEHLGRHLHPRFLHLLLVVEILLKRTQLVR
jgi:hypothetical protein